MSTPQHSYRKLYNALERASSWLAIDLWQPTGTLFSGKWTLDQSKLPKWLKRPLPSRLWLEWQFACENSDNQNKIIRITLMRTQEAGYVTFTPATQPYVQLTFYHPKA